MKGFAVFIILAGITIGMFNVITGYTAYDKNKDNIQYASVYGGNTYGYRILEESGNKAYKGREQMIYGGVITISSLLTGLPLYGIGSILKTVRKMQETLDLIELHMRS